MNIDELHAKATEIEESIRSKFYKEYTSSPDINVGFNIYDGFIIDETITRTTSLKFDKEAGKPEITTETPKLISEDDFRLFSYTIIKELEELNAVYEEIKERRKNNGR